MFVNYLKNISYKLIQNEFSVLTAFGDGENDIDMLLSVGKGIAMGNAAEKVKEIAADICESVTDDGIYYYLKSQKLINE